MTNPRRTATDTEKIASTRFLDQIEVEISTIGIFKIGSYDSGDEPIIYETMIFAEPYPEIHGKVFQTVDRAQALQAHDDTVHFVAGYLCGYPFRQQPHSEDV